MYGVLFDHAYIPSIAARYAYEHNAYGLPIRVRVLPYRYRGKPMSIGISDHKAIINILVVSRPHIQQNRPGQEMIIDFYYANTRAKCVYIR